jgi:predicted Zn-dependent peptidase
VFAGHPYAWLPAGHPVDLLKLSVTACQKFYDSYYVPNNALIVLVGDIKEADARLLVDRHFAGIGRGPEPPRGKVEHLPDRSGPREVVRSVATAFPAVVAGFQVPGMGHPDGPALEVAATLLSEGESSRVYRRLIRDDKLALGAGGDVQFFESAGLFLVYAAHQPEVEPGKVRAALLDEGEKMRAGEGDESDVGRAKNQLAV